METSANTFASAARAAAQPSAGRRRGGRRRRCWRRTRPARWTNGCAATAACARWLARHWLRPVLAAPPATACDATPRRRGAVALLLRWAVGQLRPDRAAPRRADPARGLAGPHQLAADAGAVVPVRLRCRCRRSATATAAMPTSRPPASCAGCGRSARAPTTAISTRASAALAQLLRDAPASPARAAGAARDARWNTRWRQTGAGRRRRTPGLACPPGRRRAGRATTAPRRCGTCAHAGDAAALHPRAAAPQRRARQRGRDRPAAGAGRRRGRRRRASASTCCSPQAGAVAHARRRGARAGQPTSRRCASPPTPTTR